MPGNCFAVQGFGEVIMGVIYLGGGWLDEDISLKKIKNTFFIKSAFPVNFLMGFKCC